MHIPNLLEALRRPEPNPANDPNYIQQNLIAQDPDFRGSYSFFHDTLGLPDNEAYTYTKYPGARAHHFLTLANNNPDTARLYHELYNLNRAYGDRRFRGRIPNGAYKRVYLPLLDLTDPVKRIYSSTQPPQQPPAGGQPPAQPPAPKKPSIWSKLARWLVDPDRPKWKDIQ